VALIFGAFSGVMGILFTAEFDGAIGDGRFDLAIDGR